MWTDFIRNKFNITDSIQSWRDEEELPAKNYTYMEQRVDRDLHSMMKRFTDWKTTTLIKDRKGVICDVL